MGKSAKLPSPCIDVCKFRRDGHCAGCSMTKAQKKISKRLRSSGERAAFIEMLLHQQNGLGRYSHWRRTYAKKCAKRGVEMPGSMTAI
ncbi:MAG: DUF1289 domain-containing protein [Pseudomonadota bacterium]